MKKILFVVFAVALVAFTACTKEEANFGSNAPVGSIKFVASFDQDTKTVLNSSSKTEWEKGDLISINGVKFEAVESGAQVTFINVEQPTGEFHEPFLAVYPYSANMTYSGSTCAGVVLSDSQEATEASFAQNAAIEMAYTNTTDLSFKNVCSVVKFKVGTDNITSVEITANNGENLAGTINLNYNNGAPIATVASGGSPKVTLSGTFNKTPYYYVAVLASGLQNGITIRLNGTIAKTVANEQAFKRNTIMDAGTLSLSQTSPDNTSALYLKGAFNSWGDNTPMYYESGMYVARNVALIGDFKIYGKVNNVDKWYGGTAQLNSWFNISTSGGNMKIAAANGTYDVYMSLDNNKLYIVKSGSAAPSVWGVWVNGNSKDYTMTQVGQYYVAKSVTLTANQNFKFRTFNDWAVNKGYGTVTSKKVYSLNDNGSDIKIETAGTYDIYLSTNGAYGFVVPAGHSLNNSDIFVDKYVVGAVNGTDWNADLQMYICGDYFGLKNAQIGAGGFKFRQKKGSWADADVWGKGSTAGTLAQPGADIKDKTGTCTILVDHDFKKYYIK